MVLWWNPSHPSKSKQVQNIFGCSSLFRRPSSFEIFPIDWGPQISQSIIIFRWDLTNVRYKSVLVSLWKLLQVCLRSRTKRVLQNSRNNILLLLPEGTVRSSLSVRVLAKMRLMSSNNYIAETSKHLVNRFMEHFSSKQISPLAAILLPRVTKQTQYWYVKVNAYKQSYVKSLCWLYLNLVPLPASFLHIP